MKKKNTQLSFTVIPDGEEGLVLSTALAVCRREGKPPFFLPPGPRGWHTKPSCAPHLVAEMGLTINALPHTFVLSGKLLEIWNE